MAKRRKEKDEDEDKPFKIPKFDEQAFLKRERRNIKATFIAFLFGLLMAFVCFGFWALMGPESAFRWYLVFLVCIANAAFIRYIFLRINLDLEGFARKNWLVTYAIYFFTWLLIFILVVNPPFYDDEGPYVEIAVLPGIQEFGGNVTILALVTDNVGVALDDISMVITYPNGNTTNITPVGYDWYDTVVKYVFDNPENLDGEFSFTISVEDVNGRSASPKTGSFSYDDDAINFRPLQSYDGLTSGTTLKIDVDEEVSPDSFRVYYKLNEGEEINADRDTVSDRDEYETSPEFEGWSENQNYSLKFYVEVKHFFINVPIEYNSTISDTEIYNVSTGNDNDIGDETPPMAWDWTKLPRDQAEVLLSYDDADKNNDNAIDQDEFDNKNLIPHYKTVNVPGFEAILLIAALVIVVLIFRRKKKDEQK